MTYVEYMEILKDRTNLIGSRSHMLCLLATSGDYSQHILAIIEIIRFQEHCYKFKNIQGICANPYYSIDKTCQLVLLHIPGLPRTTKKSMP